MQIYTLDLIAPIDEVERQIELENIRQAQSEAEREINYINEREYEGV